MVGTAHARLYPPYDSANARMEPVTPGRTGRGRGDSYFIISYVQLAPLPSFCLIACGSSVQLNLAMLS